MVVLQVKMRHFTSKFPELEVEAQMCTTIQPNVREKLDDRRNLFVLISRKQQNGTACVLLPLHLLGLGAG